MSLFPQSNSENQFVRYENVTSNAYHSFNNRCPLGTDRDTYLQAQL